MIKYFLRGLTTFLSLCLTLGVILMAALSTYMHFNLPNVSQLDSVQLQVPMRIYTADQKLIAEFGEKRRIPVHYDDIPPMLINAILATEDQRFFEHEGVDPLGLIRAAYSVALSGTKSQGGSTITMQVARNYFLSRKKTYARKLNEILLAIKIDQTFSKEKILELYLNKIFFGNRAYGVAAAANVYYGSKLNELTLPQMAMLAGLPKAPSSMNPLANKELALTRRNHVLHRMLEAGYITEKMYQDAMRAPVTARYHGSNIEVSAPYVAEMVRQYALENYGENAYTQGLQVHTTIDSHLQDLANQSAKKAIASYNKRHGHSQTQGAEGALVALHPDNGSLLALVGGFDDNPSHFNRATQSQRQPGSNIKPFLYAAALEKGMTLATLINDAPIVIKDPGTLQMWRPQNDSRNFEGPTRLRVGLMKSRNLVSIRILDNIGIDFARSYLQNFGFKPEQLPEGLSLALGTATISPLELAGAYAVLANGGHRVKPFFISKIVDTNQKVLYLAQPDQVVSLSDLAEKNITPAPQVISPQIAFLITSAMKDVIKEGTGRAARVLNRDDLAGKTGTTNDQNDAWFSGFNRDLVVVTWIGFDEPKSLHEYGAQAALPMWVDFMGQALANKPEHSLAEPPGIVSIRIDPTSGLPLTENNTSKGVLEYFRENLAPKATPASGDPSPDNNETQPANNDVPTGNDTTPDDKHLF